MKAIDYWHVFLETGAPEAYLLYHAALKREDKHVSDNPWDCSQDQRLQ